MGEPLPSAYIEAVTKRVFPQASNNRFALIDSVKRLLDLVQALTVDEFAFIRSNLNGGDFRRDDEWKRLPSRLELLSHRLEADGSYVDAGIVHMAFEAMSMGSVQKTHTSSRVYSDRDLLELFRMLLRQQIQDERINNVTELHGLLAHVEEALA